jgi:hypothetical protein
MKINLRSVTRLRNEHANLGDCYETIGLKEGQIWAERKATYTQLRRLDLWWTKFHFPPIGTPLALCYEAAGAITPAGANNDRLRAAVVDMFFRSDPGGPLSIRNDYVADWITSAVRVLRVVEMEN